MLYDLQRDWSLDDDMDALLGRLNPRRAKYIVKWGEDLIHALHCLCQITESRAQHERVKKALVAKIEARRAYPDMPNDP
jgi:hypothetical protein